MTTRIIDNLKIQMETQKIEFNRDIEEHQDIADKEVATFKAAVSSLNK